MKRVGIEQKKILSLCMLILIGICLSPRIFSKTISKPHGCSNLTLRDAANAIRNKRATSVTCVREYLQRIKKFSKIGEHTELNSFISLNPKAMDLAKKADAVVALGKTDKPLLGVPIVVKDNINTTSMPTSAGTPALKNNFTHDDAIIIKRLKKAGAIILGKTNMHELAAGVTSNNYYFGPVRNPASLTKFAGGSSGGTAAAIAAWLAPAGLGTDTAGSIRIPASLTGIVGFRPSSGRYSSKGVVPVSHTLDTVGLMARKVEDIIFLDNIIVGERKLAYAKIKLSSIRLGVPKQFFFNNLDPQTARAIKAALNKLKEKQVKLIAVDVSGVEQLIQQTAFPIAFYEFPQNFQIYLNQYQSGVTVKDVITKTASPDVKQAFTMLQKNPVTKQSYNNGLSRARPKLQDIYQQLFTKHKLNAIVFPTTPLPARNIDGSLHKVCLNGKQVSTVDIYTRNTQPAASAGLPAISIPVASSKHGLPIGLELDGARNNDVHLLEIALAIETALSAHL